MFSSKLYDEKTFYEEFLRDLKNCKSEIIIESPFITTERMKILVPHLQRLINRGVKIFVVTRDPPEHEEPYKHQSEIEIRRFESLGIQTFICKGNHHRKLAIIDRTVLWEGSLNILSQAKSREIMRRIDEPQAAQEMFNFLKLKKYI